MKKPVDFWDRVARAVVEDLKEQYALEDQSEEGRKALITICQSAVRHAGKIGREELLKVTT